MKTKDKQNTMAAAMAGALAAATMTFFAGCGGGGSSGGASGSSTITGSVKSYKTMASLFRPSQSASGLARLAGAISDLLVPSAHAAVGGVNVKVKGTDLGSTTANDGLFVISGVPAGTRTLVFEFNGDAVEVEVEVPDHSTVHLDGVNVDSGSASTEDDGAVEIEHESTEIHDVGDDNGTDGTNDVHHSGGDSGKDGSETNSGSGHT